MSRLFNLSAAVYLTAIVILTLDLLIWRP